MREELSDALAGRLPRALAAEAAPDRRFDVDAVAGDLVDKLVRRHPHVLGTRSARRGGGRGGLGGDQADRQAAALPDGGGPRSQPAAAWGAAPGGGRAAPLRPPAGRAGGSSPEERGSGSRRVTAAVQQGWDAEDALREAVRRYAGELDAEAAARATS